MAVAFSSLDGRLSRDLRELHDYLWNPGWMGDEGELRADLLKDARSLDTFLGVKGRLRTNAEALTKPWSRDHQGASLFELLDGVLGLTAATELVRRNKYHEAAARAQAVVESMSIGVCSAAGCFEIVEEWEARKIDFETYSGKLADVLQSKSISNPGQFRRVLNTVHDFGVEWDGSSSKIEQAIAGRTAIDSAAWCVGRSLAIRALLGEPQKVPEKDFDELLRAILERL